MTKPNTTATPPTAILNTDAALPTNMVDSHMTSITRLAYIGPVPPIRGGISQHGANLVTALRHRGVAVDVFSWKRQYPSVLYPGTERDDGPGFADARHTLRWSNPMSWVGVGSAAGGADAIVFPWVTPFHAVPIRAIRASSRTRSIAVIHNPLPHDRHLGDRLLTRLGLAGVDGAICHTDAIAQAIRRSLPTAQIRVAPHPPNLEAERTPAESVPPPIRLLMPGFVRPYKGLTDALDAMVIAGASGLDVELTVAGDFWSPSIEQARVAVSDRGLDTKVVLEPGYLPDGDLKRLISSTHAVVLPYRDGTQSGLIPLSLSAGRPVITTDAGGLAQQVRPGVDGIVCRRNDARSLADAMAALAADYDRYATAAGSDLPTWDNMAAAVLDLATGEAG